MHELPPPVMPGPKLEFGIRGIGYHFDDTVPIDTLPGLSDNPELVKTFKAAGHERCSISRVGIVQQAILTARKTLNNSGLSAADIDAVVIGTSELRDWADYPEEFSTEVLLALGLKDILVVGVTIAGCANYASALRVARNMIAVDGYRNILVIESNQVRGGSARVHGTVERAGFILGDGAVSYIATSAPGDFNVLGMGQIVKPMDTTVANAAFGPNNISGFRHVLNRSLAQAGVSREQIAKVFLHNMRFAAMTEFMRVLDFPQSKLCADTLAKMAHVWGAENLIGLHDYCAAENPEAGTLFLMLCQADFYYSAVICQKQ
jgi:3-oxoacyl-[acyl-carrier-protein] synthase III